MLPEINNKVRHFDSVASRWVHLVKVPVCCQRMVKSESECRFYIVMHMYVSV